MRKVKYIKGLLNNLTPGNVYDVLDISEVNTVYNIPVEAITIINDIGEIIMTHTSLLGQIYFIDITAEYRNDIIDGILL